MAQNNGYRKVKVNLIANEPLIFSPDTNVQHNVFHITNNGNVDVYLSDDTNISENDYDMIIPRLSHRLFSKPIPIPFIALVSSANCSVTIESIFEEFSATFWQNIDPSLTDSKTGATTYSDSVAKNSYKTVLDKPVIVYMVQTNNPDYDDNIELYNDATKIWSGALNSVSAGIIFDTNLRVRNTTDSTYGVTIDVNVVYSDYS